MLDKPESPVTRWGESPLWLEIQRRGRLDHPAQLLLRASMPDIQRVLEKGSSSPKDFTLHDAGHGFRVSNWAAQLVGPDLLQELSDNEVALLLLASYLHDIGMTPEWGKVFAHKEYLLSGSIVNFNGNELDVFQLWLAEREGLAFAPPVKSIQKMEELMTYYCRSRHNEWSAEWISNRYSGHEFGLYSGWLEDLILICKSHHEGYDALANTKFDPRDMGSAGVVHRRYLAAILRVADILENDPERTPDVILRHRTIMASSQPYWQKDHELGNPLNFIGWD